MAEIVELRDDNSIQSNLLQDELFAVIKQDRYDELKLSQVIGVLEFLKWNIINGA